MIVLLKDMNIVIELVFDRCGVLMCLLIVNKTLWNLAIASRYFETREVIIVVKTFLVIPAQLNNTKNSYVS